MHQFDLTVDKRETGSKQHLKGLRTAQMIPCAAYGHNEDTRHYSVKETEMLKLFQKVGKETAIINLVDGKKKHMTIVKDIQRDPKTYKILHIDFQILHKGEAIKVDIPIELTGASIGVKEGGILEQLIREVSVKVLPSRIPEHFQLDITALQTGDSLHVSDIDFDGEILDSPDETVCIIAAPRTEAETEEEEEEGAEGAAEPEIIGEAKEGEEAKEE